METLNKKDTDKTFSCGCRSWRITENDKTNQKNTDGYFSVHSCDKINVYQIKKGLNRIFNRKICTE